MLHSAVIHEKALFFCYYAIRFEYFFRIQLSQIIILESSEKFRF